MMSDIVQIGFKVNTAEVEKGYKRLDKMGQVAEKAEGKVTKSTDEMGKSFSMLGSNIDIVRNALAGLAASSGILSAVNANKEFAKSVSSLSAITGAAGDDLEFYKQQASEIGATTTLSASQAVTAFKLIASAKPDLLASKEALAAVTREAVILSEATGGELALADAASALGGALNQFQLDASEANAVVNLLAEASRSGSADVVMISDSLVNVGAAANSMGISLTETIAGLEALAAGEIKGSEAGTGLRQVLIGLEKTNNSNLMPSMVGLTKAVENYAAMNLSTTDTIKMFGAEGLAAASTITAQIDTLSKLTGTLDGTNTAYSQAATQTDNLDGDLKSLNSVIESLSISFGEGLDPSLRSAAQSLTDLLANTNKIENASKAVATVIVAALIPATVKYTTSLYTQVSAQLLANTQSVRTINALGQVAVAAGSATVATNGLAMATKFLLGPWGLLLAAVTAAGVAYSLTNEEVEKQNKSLDEQNKITEKLTKNVKNLTDTQKSNAAIKAQFELNDLKSEQERLEAEILTHHFDENQFASLTLGVNERLSKNKERQVQLQKLLAELQKDEKPEESTSTNEKLEAQLLSLEKMTSQLSMTEEQRFIDDQVRKAKERGDTQEQINLIKEQAQSYIDAKNKKKEFTDLISGTDTVDLFALDQSKAYDQWIESISTTSTQIADLRAEIEKTQQAVANGDLTGSTGEEYIAGLRAQIDELDMSPLQRWAKSINTASTEAKRLQLELEKASELKSIIVNLNLESESLKSQLDAIKSIDVDVNVEDIKSKVRSQIDAINAKIEVSTDDTEIKLLKNQLEAIRSIDIGVNIEDFKSKVQSQVGAIKAQIEVSADDAEIKSLKSQLEAIRSIDVGVNVEDIKSKVQSQIDAINAKIEVSTDDTEIKSLKAQLESIKSIDIDLLVSSDVDSVVDELTARIENLSDEKVKLGVDSKDIDEYISGLHAQIDDLNVNPFESMTQGASDALSAMSGMFESGSKDAKKLAIAMQALNLVQAVGAVLNQGNGDPYTAFGRMAAMATMVASLGMSISGLSGGLSDDSADNQANQNLNSWGEHSESIANSTDLVANSTEKLVGINTNMLEALKGLNLSITAAAGIAAKNITTPSINQDGLTFEYADISNIFEPLGIEKLVMDPLGLFGKAINKLFGGESKVTDEGIRIMGGYITDLIDDVTIDAFQTVKYKKWKFGSTKKKTQYENVGDDVESQFSLVFESIANSVAVGAEMLGMSQSEIELAINSFEIATQNLSLKGLDVDEKVEVINNYFSSVFNDLALAVVPFLEEFQQAGEELGETLSRLATEVSVAEYLVDNFGVNFGDKMANPEAFAQAATNLAELAGGVDKLAEQTSSFTNAFATDAQKFEIYKNAMEGALSEVGLALPSTAEGMFDLMASLDGTTEEGQKQIAVLLGLTDTASAYFKLLDDTAGAYREAAEGLYEITEATREMSLESALAAARFGDFSLAEQLDLSAIAPSTADFASKLDYNLARAETAAKLNELADLQSGRVSVEDKQLTVLEEIRDKITVSDTMTEQDIAKEISDLKYQMNKQQTETNDYLRRMAYQEA